jgi:hypothetical protein
MIPRLFSSSSAPAWSRASTVDAAPLVTAIDKAVSPDCDRDEMQPKMSSEAVALVTAFSAGNAKITTIRKR